MWNDIQQKGHVVLDTETTGSIPYYHEVIDMAVVSLTDTFEVNDAIPNFLVKVRPQYPERIQDAALKCNGYKKDELMARTLSRTDAVELFSEWIKQHYTTKLQPLAHNWPFDKAFLSAFLSPNDLNAIFNYHSRDTMAVAQYYNDRATLKGVKPAPCGSGSLDSLCKLFGVPKSGHTALGDAIATANVYRAFLSR